VHFIGALKGKTKVIILMMIRVAFGVHHAPLFDAQLRVLREKTSYCY